MSGVLDFFLNQNHIKSIQNWFKTPLTGACIIVVILAVILIPYWWLAVKWSETTMPSPSVHFTFTTTTFLLVLIVIDCAFLIRYYQIERTNLLNQKTDDLKKGEDNYRNLIEMAPFPVVISRLSDSTLLMINHRTAEIFEVEPSEVIGKEVQNYYVDLKEREKVLEILLKNHFLSDFEVELISSKGRKIWASLSASMITYQDEPSLFIAFADISRRKELENTLKKSEELHRTVVTTSPDAIVISDPAGKMVMVSPAAIRMFGGRDADDFIGKSVLEFIHPDDADRARQKMADLFTGVHLEPRQYRGKRVDGTFFPYEIHTELIHDIHGNPSGIVYVIRDITRRVEAEEAIREYQERFVTIFEEIPDPLLILDETGRVHEMNRSGEEHLKIQKEKILGVLLHETGLFHAEGNRDPIRFILDKDSKDQLETIINLPDGSKRYVILRTRWFTINQVPEILLLIHDIDEIRRTQDALAQVNNRINILNSITRHDILNRVMAVTAYSEMLQEDITDRSLLRKINTIYESGKDIQHLIEFTREYQDLGVKKPVWQGIDKFFETRSIKSLLTNISVILPDTRVEIFTDQMLEKVIYNLIENSKRHGGAVTSISVSYRKQGDALIIIYEDNGCGISQDDKGKIFMKGYGKNTGLGLFLIREILIITGITISETGIPGQGVRFEMTVPAGAFRIPD